MTCILGFEGEDRVIEGDDVYLRLFSMANRIKADEDLRTGSSGNPKLIMHLPVSIEQGAALMRPTAIQCQGYYEDRHGALTLRASCNFCRYHRD